MRRKQREAEQKLRSVKDRKRLLLGTLFCSLFLFFFSLLISLSVFCFNSPSIFFFFYYPLIKIIEKMIVTTLGMSQLMFIVGAALQASTGAAIISAMYSFSFSFIFSIVFIFHFSFIFISLFLLIWFINLFAGWDCSLGYYYFCNLKRLLDFLGWLWMANLLFSLWY